MSEENLEAIQRGFEALNRRDIEAQLEGVHIEVEWRPVFQVMLGGEATMYRGHEGVRDPFREWHATLAEIQMEVSEVWDLGERIVAIGRIRASGKESAAEVESPAGSVVDIKDGKAARVREYLDRKEDLEAIGLSKPSSSSTCSSLAS
jgi:ketosteroid isomerase-like protein